MGGLMGGIYWVINRRMRLAAQAADEVASEAYLSPEAHLNSEADLDSEASEAGEAGGEDD